MMGVGGYQSYWASRTVNGKTSYPVLSSASPNAMASGDRLGLSKVGKAAGCINTSSMPLKDLS